LIAARAARSRGPERLIAPPNTWIKQYDCVAAADLTLEQVAPKAIDAVTRDILYPMG
jgi:hypothetical protein